MIWKKYAVENRKIPVISTLSLILIIVSLYLESQLVMFLAVFFLITVCFNHLYLKKAGEGLSFDNLFERNRFFVNDEGKWVLTFQNEGYPIIKAELRVYFDQFVAPLNKNAEPSLSMYDLSIPFSIYTKQNKRIIIPFSAKQRGIAKIRKLELYVPSLLGYGEIILETTVFLKQQAVVFPEPIPVKGLKEQVSTLLGENVVSYSQYEDRLGTVGTRDYNPSDSFNRIHWKASARKQCLQTKLYENISDKGWNIALNVSDGHSMTGHLEVLISSLTEFAYFAFKKQIPYSLCINVRTAGSTPFLYLPKGVGKEHLQKVLETLASVSTQNSSLPYDYMLSFFFQHLAVQPFFIHAGIRTEDHNRLLQLMANKGILLYDLKLEKEQCLFSPLQFQYGKGGGL